MSFMLSVANKLYMLGVIILHVFMPNVIMLNVVMLRAITLNVVMLRVFMLNVVAPFMQSVTFALYQC